jgi:membrane associated rhomboid family serine protease
MNKVINAVKSDLSRIQYNSPVILTYALICFGALLLGGITKNWTLTHLFSVYRSSLTDPLAYFRVFGHAMGHVNFEHYFGNILLVLMIGPMLEEKYGSRNIALMMGLTALVTGLAHIGVVYITSNNVRLSGGSGIVFMLILLSSYANVKAGRIPLTLIVSVAVFLGREVVSVVTLDNNNVSYFTHVLGGLCGAAFGFILNKKAGKLKSREPAAAIKIKPSVFPIRPKKSPAAKPAPTPAASPEPVPAEVPPSMPQLMTDFDNKDEEIIDMTGRH